MDDDLLVRDYLSRLDAAAAALSGDRREELLGEVRAHIRAALAETGRSDEITVRNILERLGSPEEIVAGEGDQVHWPIAAAPGVAPPAAGDSRWGSVEIIALVMLGLAWPALFLPFGLILWLAFGIVGLLLAWSSGIWSPRQKVMTTIIVVALYAGVYLAFFGAGPGPVEGPAEQNPIVVPGPEETPALSP